MMKRKKPILEIIYVVFLVTAIILLFSWFKLQNSKVIKEQNRTYASDSAKMKAIQVDNELNNALSRINTYAYFVGEGLTEPVITAQMLENMERNSQFDAIMFTDFAGTDYASDGRTSDVTKRHFYNDGIKGNSNIEVIFDPHFFKETMMCVYSPVYYDEQVIGVLRGAFLADKYLKNMLGTTYFGEEAQVFLCAPDGRVIAHSDNSTYEGHLIDAMLDTDMIDEATAGQARQVFERRRGCLYM